MDWLQAYLSLVEWKYHEPRYLDVSIRTRRNWKPELPLKVNSAEAKGVTALLRSRLPGEYVMSSRPYNNGDNNEGEHIRGGGGLAISATGVETFDKNEAATDEVVAAKYSVATARTAA